MVGCGPDMHTIALQRARLSHSATHRNPSTNIKKKKKNVECLAHNQWPSAGRETGNVDNLNHHVVRKITRQVYKHVSLFMKYKQSGRNKNMFQSNDILLRGVCAEQSVARHATLDNRMNPISLYLFLNFAFATLASSRCEQFRWTYF